MISLSKIFGTCVLEVLVGHTIELYIRSNEKKDLLATVSGMPIICNLYDTEIHRRKEFKDYLFLINASASIIESLLNSDEENMMGVVSNKLDKVRKIVLLTLFYYDSSNFPTIGKGNKRIVDIRSVLPLYHDKCDFDSLSNKRDDLSIIRIVEDNSLLGEDYPFSIVKIPFFGTRWYIDAFVDEDGAYFESVAEPHRRWTPQW